MRVTKGEAAEFGVVVEMGLGSVEVELLEALPEGEDEPLMPGWLDHVETETFQVRTWAAEQRKPQRKRMCGGPSPPSSPSARMGVVLGVMLREHASCTSLVPL